mmetsp:Transcript_68019/g.215162  ORF Transcript_68019/g.215162 Transcript_68019/m.215162 type:complete len:340 (+) Transcript_68019:289-1308(+)
MSLPLSSSRSSWLVWHVTSTLSMRLSTPMKTGSSRSWLRSYSPPRIDARRSAYTMARSTLSMISRVAPGSMPENSMSLLALISRSFSCPMPSSVAMRSCRCATSCLRLCSRLEMRRTISAGSLTPVRSRIFWAALRYRSSLVPTEPPAPGPKPSDGRRPSPPAVSASAAAARSSSPPKRDMRTLCLAWRRVRSRSFWASTFFMSWAMILRLLIWRCFCFALASATSSCPRSHSSSFSRCACRCTCSARRAASSCSAACCSPRALACASMRSSCSRSTSRWSAATALCFSSAARRSARMRTTMALSVSCHTRSSSSSTSLVPCRRPMKAIFSSSFESSPW